MLHLRPAQSPADLDAARVLFCEYAGSLPIDLGFQGFDEELASLPGCYASPRGVILLAWEDATPVGCIALRPFDQETGEIKRLYVRADHRRQHIARRLVEAALIAARNIRYRQLVLDTLPSMMAAIHLYESLGFARTSRYYNNPHEAVYFRLSLGDG